jgi:Putative capsular polysaccharide synthesis protein
MRRQVNTRRALRRNPIIVHQMGKVGSQSVLRSLAAEPRISTERAVVHTHFLTRNQLARERRLLASAKAAYQGTPLPEIWWNPPFIWDGLIVGAAVTRERDRRWEVITLVRDPVARNVSLFFEKLEVPIGYDWFERRPRLSDDELLAELDPLFERHVLDPGGLARLDVDPLLWFDLEMAPVFGVHIFGSPFATDRGWQIYEGERARLLLIRTADLDRVGAEALEQFLGVPGIQLVSGNVADRREHASVYALFRERLRLPPEQLDATYGSRLVTHLFTPQEIEAMRSKWETVKATG